MLICYRFNNLCSFYGDSEFSMRASGGKVLRRFPDNYTKTDNGYSLLKTAVVVGENAGGKSNFIKSLRFLKSLFKNNEQVKAFYPYLNSTALEEKEETTQTFEIVFQADNSRVYKYDLEIDVSGISREALFVAEKKRSRSKQVLEVERSEDGRGYETVGEKAKAGTKKLPAARAGSMGLFVTKLALLGDEDAEAAVNWMNHRLCIESITPDMESDEVRLEEDMKILKDEQYLEIFRMVDYSICAIEVDEEKPYSKTLIKRKNKNGTECVRDLEKDSAGVKEFFAWAAQIFRVVYQDKVVFADGMDRVLNPILSDRVIAYINGKSHHGQFIFSTHNVLHLDLETYMKEQIYFVTKEPETLLSEIYSLADFPEVRYQTAKVYEFYMKGILEGIYS